MKRKCLWGLFGLLFVTTALYGGIVSWQSLPGLMQSADAIVVGTAGGGGQSGPVLSFTLSIERVLKGDPALIGATIPVDCAVPTGGQGGASAAGTHANGNGLWFLQSSSSSWELLPVMQGDIFFDQGYLGVPPGSILGAYSYSPTASLSDKVASEISAALEAANGGGHRLLGLYFGLLDQLNSPVIRLLYQRMSTSASLNQKILGLSGLIRGGSAPALSAAIEMASSLGAYPLESGVLFESVRNEFRSTDSTSVGILGQIATASTCPSQPLREAAAHALVAIHTQQAAAVPRRADRRPGS